MKSVNVLPLRLTYITNNINLMSNDYFLTSETPVHYKCVKIMFCEVSNRNCVVCKIAITSITKQTRTVKRKKFNVLILVLFCILCTCLPVYMCTPID